MADPALKICGISNPEDLVLLSSYGPDYLGFVFYERSPRYVQPEQLATWLAVQRYHCGEVGKTMPKLVGVFVDLAIPELLSIAERCKLDVLQLHGSESRSCLEELRAQTDCEIWKAIRLGSGVPACAVAEYTDFGVLLDSWSADAYGGTGRRVQASLLREALALHHRVILAGGVAAENVSEFYALGPFAVDLSSSLESAPGKKDAIRLARFFSAWKNIQNNNGSEQ